MSTERANLYLPSSGVVELTIKDFHENMVINSDFRGKDALIFFYAPWCIHCQKMSEYLSQIAIQFQYVFPIGVVNCENPRNYKICRRFDIQMFPTPFYLNKKGIMTEYQDPIDKDSLMNFIYQKTL